MLHPRASARARRRRGLIGPPATPWKYLVGGKPVRRGRRYHARLLKDGVVLWEGTVLG